MSIKVLHIVAGDLSEGAARGAYWLHRGLLECGVESKMVVQNAGEEDPTVQSVAQTSRNKVLRMLRIVLDRLPVELYRNRENFIFSTGISGFDIRKFDVYQCANVVHLHWINNGMMNVKLLKKIDKPIVWTMRDMWPMTGGCHYAMECKGYETGCGCCPQLGSNNRFDLSWYILKRKKRYYSKKIKLVAISRWLAECAKSSDLFRGFDVSVIHNAVDTKEFFAIEREVARDLLGLPKDKKIVLAGATNIHQKYKGFGKFQDAIRYFDKKHLFLFFGEVNRDELENLDIDFHSLGFLRDTISLRLAYSAADVFVVPSIQEAFGKTLIEAMACGTPVVAFDATGPKDIVEHKRTGYLARPFDVEDLAKGIAWVIENEARWQVLSHQSRQKVEDEFAIESVAQRYAELYKEVLER